MNHEANKKRKIRRIVKLAEMKEKHKKKTLNTDLCKYSMYLQLRHYMELVYLQNHSPQHASREEKT
jgi:hypothetical protein